MVKNGIEKQDSHANNNVKCKEQYLVPIAWHVIFDSQGRGNVSDAKLEVKR